MITNNTIQTRSLVKTRIQVTPIGLGATGFSGGGLLGRVFPLDELTRQFR